MSKALATTTKKNLAPAGARARKYAEASRSEKTIYVYKHFWIEFTAWAVQQGADSLPAQPATVNDFVTAQAEAGAKPATIAVKVAAISAAHKTAGQPDPTKAEEVRLVLAGIRRKLGTRPQKKAPIGRAELAAMVAALPDSLAGKRNRALILLGFAGAFRRSELVALDVEDLRINGELKVTIRKSKTDQEGRGMVKVIPRFNNDLCPVAALTAWLDAAEIKSGAVFCEIDKWGHSHGRLTGQSVARIVKAVASGAGLDPRQFAGHSLRSGFITTAYAAGASATDIAEVSGHKSLDVLRGYIQDAGLGGKRAIRAALGTGDEAEYAAAGSAEPVEYC